ncbi:MAG TPA: thiamine ABC transporter substrate-binding protein [Roseiflexaceae bacterium]|nr:thiamine ABC transporter substrate-binding protein [Roseiflexaceae bacterium]
MYRLLIGGLLLALLVACGGQAGAPQSTAVPPPTAAPTTAESPALPAGGASGQPALVVMTHDSFNISQETLAAFERQTGARVELLPSGDAGAALTKAILSKDAPLADVFFGVDNTFLSRAVNADIFEPYESPALQAVPERFRLDPSHRLTPIDYGYVAINYDKAALAERGLQPPQDLRELTRPEWKGTLVVENPATSSPGLAFLIATVATFGESGDYTWLDFWRELRANDVLVSEGWEDAYYTQFSGSSGKGPRPLVVSYLTSPAAEVFFSEGKLSEPPTGNVLAGSFLQIEFAGILKGTRQRPLAERFIDFMLSKPFQEDIPLNMFVYPVLPDAALPEVFQKFAQVPEQPAGLPPEQIEQNRERWIEEWTRTVLR